MQLFIILSLSRLFGIVIARERESTLACATLSTLYPKNSFTQIGRHRRSSLDGRGIFDSGRSLQVKCILMNISPTTFRHCRESSYASFGQPFPKQLYNLPCWMASYALAHPKQRNVILGWLKSLCFGGCCILLPSSCIADFVSCNSIMQRVHYPKIEFYTSGSRMKIGNEKFCICMLTL